VSWLKVASIGLLAAIGASGCGIPSDEQPRAIPEAAVPEQAREPRGTGTTASTALPSTPTQEQMIYLVGGSPEQPRLVQTGVQVPSSTDAGTLAANTIQQLIGTRPEDVGLAGNATNQIPSSVQVVSARIQPAGVLDLDLTLELSQVESERLRLAIAQIVFTATEPPTSGISGVRFFINGAEGTVPTGSGSSTEGQPVSRADYAEFDPQLQPPAE
jgi:spore germination protein GerM